jgi:drug/metabolite transporter (DMT)-like permease
MKTGVLPLHLIRDVFGVGSYFLYFLAIRYLNLVDAATLNYTAPFFVPLVWWVWRNEKIPTNAWYSIIIGFMGVAIILNPGKAMFQMGFIYGLFAGITSAVALSAVRVLNIHKEPMSRTLFYYFLCGSCLTAPFAWAIWDPPTGIEWVKAISIGVFTAIGQMLLTIAYRYGTASYLSPLGYMVIVYAGLISYFLFGVPLTLRSLVGTCLIVLGGTLTFIFKKKPATIQQVFEAPQAKEKPPL